MTSNGELYRFLPLDKYSSNIRILKVHKANAFEDPLICDLQVEQLDSQPQYAALSYTWGDQPFDHHLECNKQSLNVTDSLDYAIRLFRQHFAGQKIWIDQICINQNDTTEKTSQISMMNKIYRKASHVLVYLGRFDSNSRMGVKLAQDVKIHSAEILRDLKREGGLPYYIPSANHPSWESWRNLFYRLWWSRVWVIQEAISNSSVSVLCEEDMFDWDILPFSYFFLSNLMEEYPALFNLPLFAFTPEMPQLQGRMHAWRSIMDKYNNSKSAIESNHLGEILDMIRTFSAKDPHDKIYAILGLTMYSSEVPKMDYNLPVERVYRDFAEYLCSNGKLFMVLSVAGLKRALPNLPTWVPDWTCDNQGLSFQRIEGLGYCAGGDSKASIKCSGDAGLIITHSALIDTIVAIGPVREKTQPLDLTEFVLDYVPWTLDSWELINSNDNFRSLVPYARLEMFSSLVSAGSPTVKHPLNAHAAYFTSFYSALSPDTDISNPFEICKHLGYDSVVEDELNSFINISSKATKSRKICITSKGFIGLAPDLTEVGDEVCIFQGARAPFILRNIGDAYNVVGDAFILNLMKGESLKMDSAFWSSIRLQ
ncbi:hypothetical protein B7463_g5926, partial [Scytalidium lignicola]